MFNQEIKEAFDRVIVLKAERCEASACINEIKSALVAKGGKLRSRWVLLRGTRPEANPKCSPVADSNSVRVSFGSGTDLRRDHQEGLLPGVKRTKSVGKRTLALERRLSG